MKIKTIISNIHIGDEHLHDTKVNDFVSTLKSQYKVTSTIVHPNPSLHKDHGKLVTYITYEVNND